MIYVCYGLEPFLIEQKIKKIWKDHQIEDMNISIYDGEEVLFTDLVEDASMPSLFAPKKGILVEDCTFLTGSTKPRTVEQDPEILEHYLEHPNPDTILIFTVLQEKLDERKKIVKLLKKNGQVYSASVPTKNDLSTIKPLFQEYQISDRDLSFLMERVHQNLYLLEKEIEKLKMYVYPETVITRNDIEAITTQIHPFDIFDFIDALVSKQKEKAIRYYHTMLLEHEEPIKVIVMLANQFRMIYQSKMLAKKGYTESDIAKELGIHPYRIKLALIKGKTLTDDVLLDNIEKLSDLDLAIKNGTKDKDLAFELFILGL